MIGRPGWTTGAGAALWLSALLALEAARPLRARVEARLRRLARNLGTAGLALVATLLLAPPVLAPVARAAEERGLGLLRLVDLPAPLELVAGFLLLDYTLWVWHWLNHRVPLFWRFHAVHHLDLDLDASTGLRFHFGEMSISVFYRALQVLALGVDRLTLDLWSAALLVSVLFHHSNLRLPFPLERRLVRLVVTPRMHGIHHSQVAAETLSNYASLLTLWDRLHRTLRLNVPQGAVTIGVPAYPAPRDVGFAAIQLFPFRRRRAPDWLLPSGEAPRRDPSPEAAHELLQ